MKQGFSVLSDDPIKQSGNKLEAKKDICWLQSLDMFLRRGAGFTQFRHIKIREQYCLYRQPEDYVEFLIKYISTAK